MQSTHPAARHTAFHSTAVQHNQTGTHRSRNAARSCLRHREVGRGGRRARSHQSYGAGVRAAHHRQRANSRDQREGHAHPSRTGLQACKNTRGLGASRCVKRCLRPRCCAWRRRFLHFSGTRRFLPLAAMSRATRPTMCAHACVLWDVVGCGMNPLLWPRGVDEPATARAAGAVLPLHSVRSAAGGKPSLRGAALRCACVLCAWC